MKIAGREVACSLLTVGELKKFIRDIEVRHGSIDDHLIYFSDMEPETRLDLVRDPGEAENYINGCSCDVYDTDSGDDDGKPIQVLELERWPSQYRLGGGP